MKLVDLVDFGVTMLLFLSVIFIAVSYTTAQASCDSCLDISVTLDCSASVGGKAWRDTLVPFVRQFATSPRINLGPGWIDTRVSVTVFGTTATLVWDFSEIRAYDNSAFLDAADDLEDNYGLFDLTNMGAGLHTSAQGIADTARDNCDVYCIVVSDGGVNTVTAFQNLMTDNAPVYTNVCNNNTIGIAVPSSEGSGLDQLNSLNQQFGPNLFENIFSMTNTTVERTFSNVVDVICPSSSFWALS